MTAISLKHIVKWIYIHWPITRIETNYVKLKRKQQRFADGFDTSCPLMRRTL